MKEELAQTTNHVSANFFKKITYFPVDTRRRFNVDTTSYDVVRRRIDVETRRVSIHHRNIQSLSIEIYKFLNGLFPRIMSNVFKQSQCIHYEQKNCNTV